MELRQLKKQLKRELKQQQATTQKSSRRRWIFFLCLFLLLAVISYWFFLQQQATAPQRLFVAGVKLESQGKIIAAAERYQEIYQTYPQADNAAAALFKLGKIRQHDQQDDQLALLSYLQLEHDYPASELVLPAREEAAQIVKYLQRDYSRAIEFYQRLLDLNSGTPDKYYYEIADCYFRLENFSQARIELEMLLEKYPQTTFAADALYRKGAISLLEGHTTAARQDWRQLIKQYPDSRHRSNAEFDLAKLLEEEGFLKEALLLYRQLSEESNSLLLKEKIKHLQQRIAEKQKAI